MMEALFDLSDFEEPKPASVYAGRAPLGFTSAYFHPDELLAATRWLIDERGSFGSRVGAIHSWQLGITTGWVVPEGTAAHSLCLLQCSLECFDAGPGHRPNWSAHNPIPTRCLCVGGHLDQAVCTVCEWHAIADGEGAVIEAWHDHAFPGWRDLPVVPAGIDEKRAAAWARETYPAEWQVPAAPILTMRPSFGSRHVPGRSPWGGFDLCANVDECRTKSRRIGLQQRAKHLREDIEHANEWGIDETTLTDIRIVLSDVEQQLEAVAA